MEEVVPDLMDTASGSDGYFSTNLETNGELRWLRLPGRTA
jgi:hypothetical protein